MSIEFHGYEDVMKRFDNLAEIKAVPLLNKACLVVETAAKQKAPKGRTGELARSIASRIEMKGDTYTGIVYTPLEYAPYVEYGTGLFAENGGRMDVPWVYQDETGEFYMTYGQAPQPYLRPALHEQREKVLEILGSAINDG